MPEHTKTFCAKCGTQVSDPIGRLCRTCGSPLDLSPEQTAALEALLLNHFGVDLKRAPEVLLASNLTAKRGTHEKQDV